jgi:hypothetical protein
MNLKNREVMKSKAGYNSIYEIKIARERLRYQLKLQEEKFKNVNYLLLSGISSSLRDLKFNIRNKLISFAFFRSLYKSNFVLGFAKNFIRGLRRAR